MKCTKPGCTKEGEGYVMMVFRPSTTIQYMHGVNILGTRVNGLMFCRTCQPTVDELMSVREQKAFQLNVHDSTGWFPDLQRTEMVFFAKGTDGFSKIKQRIEKAS